MRRREGRRDRYRWPRRVALLACAAAAVAACGSAPAPVSSAAPVQHQTISIGGVTRTYRIYVPATLDLRRPAPLVVVLHAALDTADATVGITGFDDVSAAQGMIAVYPQGLNNLWNARTLGCCGESAYENVDDTGFIAALLTRVESRYHVDPTRVYAVGVSNGAVLAYTLACTMAGRFAAIASVAGSMALDICHPSVAVSVLEIHGTADDLVPYDGGHWPPSGAIIPSTPAVATRWASLDGCTAIAESATTGVVTTQTWSQCSDNTSVSLITVQGGTHDWYAPGLGAADGAVDATQVIATFLRSHPRVVG